VKTFRHHAGINRSLCSCPSLRAGGIGCEGPLANDRGKETSKRAICCAKEPGRVEQEAEELTLAHPRLWHRVRRRRARFDQASTQSARECCWQLAGASERLLERRAALALGGLRACAHSGRRLLLVMFPVRSTLNWLVRGSVSWGAVSKQKTTAVLFAAR